MKDFRPLAAILIGIMIIIGIGLFLGFNSISNQVPSPATPPTEDLPPTTIDDLQFEAEAYFWQDFMPSWPPEGPPFYVHIALNVTNNGASTVTGIQAIRTSIYYLENSTLLHTFELVATDSEEDSVDSGQWHIFEYGDDRVEVFSPDIEEGTMLYARIHVVWEPLNQVILTTPPAEVLFTH